MHRLILAALLLVCAPAMAQTPSVDSITLRSGAHIIGMPSADVVGALGYTPVNPSALGNISGLNLGANLTSGAGSLSLTGGNVTGALGYAPINPANNLSDIASAATTRANLGLGAVAPIGTTVGTVAAGNDSRIVGAAQASALGAAAALNVGTAPGTVAAGNDIRFGSVTFNGAVGTTFAAPDTPSAQTLTYDESRIFGTISTRGRVSCVQVKYANWLGTWGSGESAPNSVITIASALDLNEQNDHPFGGPWGATDGYSVKLPFSFGGQHTVAIAPNGIAVSDPLCYPLKAGESFYVNTWRQSMTPAVYLPSTHFADATLFEQSKDGFYTSVPIGTSSTAVSTISTTLNPFYVALPLRPTKMQVHGAGITGFIADDGSGNIPAGSGIAAGSTINYATGALVLNLTVATAPNVIFVDGQGAWAAIPDETLTYNPPGFFPWQQHPIYGPSALYGTLAQPVTNPPFTLAIAGDSIFFGVGTTYYSSSLVDYANAGKFGIVKFAEPGAHLSDCATLSESYRVVSLFGQVDRMVNNMGINDVGKLNLAQMKANFAACVAFYTPLIKTGTAGLYWATLLPFVQSASNNTPLNAPGYGPGTVASGSPSIRNAWNAWLYTQIGVTIAGVIDTAACVEASPASQAGAGSGTWASLANTADGLHPSQAGAQLIGACVQSNAALN